MDKREAIPYLGIQRLSRKGHSRRGLQMIQTLPREGHVVISSLIYSMFGLHRHPDRPAMAELGLVAKNMGGKPLTGRERLAGPLESYLMKLFSKIGVRMPFGIRR